MFFFAHDCGPKHVEKYLSFLPVHMLRTHNLIGATWEEIALKRCCQSGNMSSSTSLLIPRPSNHHRNGVRLERLGKNSNPSLSYSHTENEVLKYPWAGNPDLPVEGGGAEGESFPPADWSHTDLMWLCRGTAAWSQNSSSIQLCPNVWLFFSRNKKTDARAKYLKFIYLN